MTYPVCYLHHSIRERCVGKPTNELSIVSQRSLEFLSVDDSIVPQEHNLSGFLDTVWARCERSEEAWI